MHSKLGLAIVILLLLPGSAISQGGETIPPAAPYAPPSSELLASIQGPARLAVYFDRIAHSRVRSVDPGESFEFHLVAVGAVGGIRAWEAQLLLDERIEVLSRELQGMNLGQGPEAFRVGVGNRCLAGQELVLVSYLARVDDPDARDLLIGVGPAPGGSADPPSPCYLSCDPEIPLLLFETPQIAAVLNPDEVSLPPEGEELEGPDFEMESQRDGQR